MKKAALGTLTLLVLAVPPTPAGKTSENRRDPSKFWRIPLSLGVTSAEAVEMSR